MSDAPSSTNGDYKLDNLDVTVKDAAGDLAKLIKDQTEFLNLPSNQIFTKPPQLSGSDNIMIGNTQVGVSASATYNATAFVHPQDVDPDGIVTTSADDAWLKQELALAASVSGKDGSLKVGAETVGVDASASGNVRLLDYRHHSIQDLAGQAVIDAILGARFVVRSEDVSKVDDNSRLAFLAGGSLSLGVTLTVADVLSSSLTALDNALGFTSFIQFQVGGTCDFEVELKDDFKLIFSRAASGRIGVDVKKVVNSQSRLTASYGVTAQFADPQAVSTALDAYITQRLGIAYTSYQTLETAVCNASAFSALPAELQGLAQQVAAALSIGDADQKLSELKSKICGLDKKLRLVIDEAASAQVKAAFTFTWSRMVSDEALLTFEIDPGAVSDYLQGLLFGNFAPVLKALVSNDPRFTLHQYLETRQETTDRSFGFSLSLGKWSLNSLTDFNNSLQTETTIKDGKLQQRLALDSRNSYTGKWIGQTEAYFVDFQATMPDFVIDPKVSDFQFGLHLSWTWQEGHSTALAARWGDLAELWGCQPGLSNTIAASDKDSVEAAVEIVLDHDGALAIAQAADKQDPRWLESWAWALATALPPIPELRLRGSVENRQQLYLQSARELLRQQGNITEVVIVPQYKAPDEKAKLEQIDLGGLDGRPLPQGNLAGYNVFNLKTLWQPTDVTGNPSRVFEDTRKTFAILAHGGSSSSSVLDIGKYLRKWVDTDPFSMRLLGAAVTRFLMQTGQAARFTTSARYTVANKTTLATSTQ